MQFFDISWLKRLVGLLLASVFISGCMAGTEEFNNGALALKNHQYDQAVAEFQTAVEKRPDNYEYRLRLINARDKASRFHKELGDEYFEQKNYVYAQKEFQYAIEMNSSNYVASSRMQQAIRYAKAQRLTEEAKALIPSQKKQAKERLHEALTLVSDYSPATLLLNELEQNDSIVIGGMELDFSCDKLLTLDFNDVKLSELFKILTKLTGINFIFDADIRDSEVKIHFEKATFDQALELILTLNKLDSKILNRKTIIIYPKNPEKQKQFDDYIIQTFYLSNIDAKKAVNLLRTMLQLKKIYVHEELNAVIIRDTPTVIKLAADILAANDRSDSEVVFDLELIEVNHTENQELGLKLSNYSIGAGLGLPGEDVIASSALQGGDSTLGLVAGTDGFKALRPFYAVPTATFRLMKTQADSEVLANPRIRVRNKEKAKVHIGNREPVITVTINGDQTSENVQYVDVGVKLDVEPRVQLDNTIVTSLGLEVSNVSGRETTSNGTAVLTISTTNANTVLTLKDGEQTIIGGLIRGDKSTTKNKIPFLGEIPFLEKLLNGTDKTGIKREILLSITPHIVKTVQVPEPGLASIWSGGEDTLKYGRNFGAFATEYAEDLELVEDENVLYGTGLEHQKDKQNESRQSVDKATATEDVERETLSKVETNNMDSEDISEPAAHDAGDLEKGQLLEKKAASVVVKGNDSVKSGDVFSVTVCGNDIEDLFSAALTVRYDNALYEFVAVEKGSLFEGESRSLLFNHSVLKDGGQLFVDFKLDDSLPESGGSEEFFVVTFRARQVGGGAIQLTRLTFHNAVGEPLNVKPVGLFVKIEE
nr:cohesin domain-containing protein [uncultured Desulfuromonas sp.]